MSISVVLLRTHPQNNLQDVLGKIEHVELIPSDHSAIPTRGALPQRKVIEESCYPLSWINQQNTLDETLYI